MSIIKRWSSYIDIWQDDLENSRNLVSAPRSLPARSMSENFPKRGFLPLFSRKMIWGNRLRMMLTMIVGILWKWVGLVVKSPMIGKFCFSESCPRWHGAKHWRVRRLMELGGWMDGSSFWMQSCHYTIVQDSLTWRWCCNDLTQRFYNCWHILKVSWQTNCAFLLEIPRTWQPNHVYNNQFWARGSI